jgi:hypothetical protein
MPSVLPLQFLLALFAGLVNRHQQRGIDYLLAENRAMRSAIGDMRLRLDDATRIRLATLGKSLGRELLERFASIVTPETILRWHRKLVAMKWTYASTSRKTRGRPRVMAAIEVLAVKMARENATWGLKRIQGALVDAPRPADLHGALRDPARDVRRRRPTPTSGGPHFSSKPGFLRPRGTVGFFARVPDR